MNNNSNNHFYFINNNNNNDNVGQYHENNHNNNASKNNENNGVYIIHSDGLSSSADALNIQNILHSHSYSQNNINNNNNNNHFYQQQQQPQLQQQQQFQDINQNVNVGGTSNYFRTLVSGKKKRFIQDGFNLDLSYITERIIAMGYPADSSVHKMFRNDISHVYNFLKPTIKIIGKLVRYTCTQRNNNINNNNNLSIILLDYIIDKWLSEHPENVVAIHCKAGKGRTGTVISSYLVHMLKNNVPEVFATSDAILSTTLGFFNSMRSKSGECVTVPSQKRYVGYYISYLRNEISYQSLLNPPIYRVANIELLFLPSSIHLTSIEIHNRYNPNIKSLPIILHKKNSTLYMDSTQSIFRIVVHTSFIKEPLPTDNGITTLSFGRSILDGATHGALDDNRFSNDFQLKIALESVTQQHYPITVARSRSLSESPAMQNLTVPLELCPPPIPDRSKKPLLLYQHNNNNNNNNNQTQQHNIGNIPYSLSESEISKNRYSTSSSSSSSSSTNTHLSSSYDNEYIL
ncbi:phosphatase tensin type domain-containing protein [Heterostelium album PN500]|uniref:Phosphatase tensin type domain-containing protein n=1 Tax=Heterostelium pallidum (strain ATCC 26659 / Pp 5 / PN500) TaxID=670386 RepID=D3BNV9_HETP5|nr:phosphatase tensin type domain-containing protein [Heterostelium album PN500]EFA76878.1 phosphatase tensin type domain-containing protein [Heterostelium album PN500]|eukprot:XP_020429010.1 phosphatase tensin type domain-containing protein [Heterostelium album PN500]